MPSESNNPEPNAEEHYCEESAFLEQDRKLFRAVFDHTLELTALLTPEGVLLDVNKAALALIDTPKEELIGRLFWETPWWVHSPEAQNKVKQAMSEAAQGEFTRYDVTVKLLPSRQVLTVDSSLTPVFDDHGQVCFIVAEGRDITARVTALRLLEDREARNRALVDSAPVGICTVTMDGIIDSANSFLHKLLGYAREELKGLPVTCILESLYDENASVDDVLETGERKVFGVARETLAMHRDGSKVPVELALSLLNLGRFRIFIVIVRDLTELRKSQQLQAQLAAIVESSEDAIYGSDMEGIVTSWNPAAERLYGFSATEAIGKSVSLLVVPEERKREVTIFQERLRKGESIGHFETVRVNREGHSLDVDITISPIRSPQGHVVGASTIARDISVRKEAERRISEFYSMVSHELRTPLTSIRASLGLLEGGIAGSIDEEALQLVQIARAESDRLILLINDILDLQKIEAGMLELKLRKVLLSELINTVTASLRPMADECGVKLKASYSRDWNFTADPDRIIQVIHNLLSNAIKYSSRSDVVRITAEEIHQGILHISVIDRGPGIRADQTHKLFGKFQQLDSSDARPQGGTGLGLAISKAIVEQHGGTIGVKTKPGEGSTFWFELPMAKHAAATSAIPVIQSFKDSGQEKCAIRGSGPPRILIVEDDKATLELLTRQLGCLKTSCILATDGQSALNILQDTRPDLLILDVGVPAPDGFELVKILRQGEMSDLPLLVYTSMDLSESDVMRLSLGPSKHLIKSVASQQDFLRSVKDLLGPLVQEQGKKT